jgi:hypothetical protein
MAWGGWGWGKGWCQAAQFDSIHSRTAEAAADSHPSPKESASSRSSMTVSPSRKPQAAGAAESSPLAVTVIWSSSRSRPATTSRMRAAAERVAGVRLSFMVWGGWL